MYNSHKSQNHNIAVRNIAPYESDEVGRDLVRSKWSVKLYILVGVICLIIGWNYWIPAYFYSSAVSHFGSGTLDFAIFYTAGSLWLSHENPYPQTGFVYPPASLVFFGIFALFNIGLARLLWMATYFTVFAVSLLALALTLEGERRALFVSISMLLFFTSFPLLVMMVLGQSDLLVASLAILSFVGLRIKRPRLSAVLLSMASLMKGPPFLLLIYFVLYRRDLRYLISFLLSSMLIVGASLLVVPFDLYSYYVTKVLPTLSIVMPGETNQSIIRYVSLVGMSKLSPIISVAGLGIFSIFSFYVNSKKFRGLDKKLRNDAMFLMNVLVMLVLGPRTWPANYVWIILPVALFLSGLLTGQVRVWYLALVGFATFLLNSTLIQTFLLFTIMPLAIMGNSIMILGLMLIYIRPTLIFEKRA